MRYTFILVLGLVFLPGLLQAADLPTKSAAEGVKITQINSKLDEILKNQKETFKQLADLKAELLIVKARATR